jgi:cytochrome c-type biogenesis protein CcmH
VRLPSAAALGAFVLASVLFIGACLAVEPTEMLKDPALEARARTIGQALRCVVCQNQSIDDSSAEVARDMRRAVRERLTAGDSDEAVRDFIVARYGEFVLLKPPLKWSTLILWLAPIALALGAAAMAARYALSTRGGARSAASSALTADEEAKLKAALDDGQDPGAGAKG